ncbi:MAG: nitroreductase [Saprospirales bacterium]|nr:MAG: nitroreductase [Saprospirales bacterium]
MKLEVIEAIKNRQSVYPKFFNGESVPLGAVEELIEIANTAPTHRLTQPWRFAVFSGDARQRLAKFLSDEYKRLIPPEKYSELKHKKRYDNVVKSSHIIAIIMQRDIEKHVPEWEEIAAVSCAVQNLWIAASAMGYGGYWSTPLEMVGRPAILKLDEGQRCLGLFYLGNHELGILPKVRGDYRDKVKFFTV